MTDQTIPADKVRTILDEWERIKEHADWDDIDNLVQSVRALLPAPAPALPDGWRLADHPHHGRVLVVRADGESAIYATPYKATGIRTRVCLASDLTFVGTDNDQKPEDAAPAKVGTVIEYADDPRIDALPLGSILIDRDEEATIKGRGEWTGAGYIPIPSDGTELGPWTVLHIPKGADQ